jgi:hypothetical protein
VYKTLLGGLAGLILLIASAASAEEWGGSYENSEEKGEWYSSNPHHKDSDGNSYQPSVANPNINNGARDTIPTKRCENCTDQFTAPKPQKRCGAKSCSQ